MDSPIQRTIRIGNATVGLIGLDVALVQLAGREITEDDAVQFLFDQVSRKNYIPEQATGPYREALRQEGLHIAFCIVDGNKGTPDCGGSFSVHQCHYTSNTGWRNSSIT